jgi:hypothetical protein
MLADSGTQGANRVVLLAQARHGLYLAEIIRVFAKADGEGEMLPGGAVFAILFFQGDKDATIQRVACGEQSANFVRRRGPGRWSSRCPP